MSAEHIKTTTICNLPEGEKSACVQSQQEHLNCVQAERELYRDVCKEAKSTFEVVENTIELNESNDACSLNATMHYSFDFAQQIHIPSNPMQPGPIYFKTPQKCGIFGVMCEAIPRQVNYLIDEAVDVGKGANVTISYVHHYFENHGLEKLMPTCMQTILDKIKITTLFGIWLGNNSSTSQLYQLFISGGRTHQVWP